MVLLHLCFFFFKQKTAYEMRISDWSSDVCSSDLLARLGGQALQPLFERLDVVVAKGDDFGIAHLAPVIDRRMAVDVEDDIVDIAGDGRDDAEGRLIAGKMGRGSGRERVRQ